ncbi:uncharacterized, partial [Tachysurus ichikawai]
MDRMMQGCGTYIIGVPMESVRSIKYLSIDPTWIQWA